MCLSAETGWMESFKESYQPSVLTRRAYVIKIVSCFVSFLWRILTRKWNTMKAHTHTHTHSTLSTHTERAEELTDALCPEYYKS